MDCNVEIIAISENNTVYISVYVPPLFIHKPDNGDNDNQLPVEGRRDYVLLVCSLIFNF
jgi:hypothetical protein